MAEEEKKDAAVEEETGEAAPPAPSVAEKIKKKSGIIIIAVLVVVGLILAGVISFFVTTKLMANTGGGNGGGEVAEDHEPGVFVKLGDDKEGLIVNIGGVKGGHFLKIGLVLELNKGKKNVVDKEGKVTKVAETKILDTTLQMLRSEKIDNYDASRQDELKKKLKDELNKVLGSGAVYSIYITSIVLQ